MEKISPASVSSYSDCILSEQRVNGLGREWWFDKYCSKPLVIAANFRNSVAITQDLPKYFDLLWLSLSQGLNFSIFAHLFYGLESTWKDNFAESLGISCRMGCYYGFYDLRDHAGET